MILRDEDMHIVESFDKARYLETWALENNEPVLATYDLAGMSKKRLAEVKKEYAVKQKLRNRFRDALKESSLRTDEHGAYRNIKDVRKRSRKLGDMASAAHEILPAVHFDLCTAYSDRYCKDGKFMHVGDVLETFRNMKKNETSEVEPLRRYLSELQDGLNEVTEINTRAPRIFRGVDEDVLKSVKNDKTIHSECFGYSCASPYYDS